MVSYNSKSDIYEIESKFLVAKKSQVKRRGIKKKTGTRKTTTNKCNSPIKNPPKSITIVGRHKGKICLAFLLIVVVQLCREAQRKAYAASARIYNDYTNIKSLAELKVISESIDSYCFPGRKKTCQCKDPMQPAGRELHRHWLKTVQENKDAVVASESEDIDVVFYGDSITEGWKGTSYGFPNGRKDGNLGVFNSLFSIKDGGKYNALPLGISGDRSPDLLWRLQNGELEDKLNPKVFWILIGTNDMGNSWCSPEAALIGILRVVEEIRSKKPGVPIVINSLFPRSFDSKGYVNYKQRLGSLRKPPALWPAIKEINEKLEEYSANHDDVGYFDVNDLFFSGTDVKDEKLKLDQNLMYDYLHPSAVGYKLWGDEIVKKLDEWIQLDAIA